MRFENLEDWLAWQETLHPAEIELGLDRLGEVSSRAGLQSSFKSPLITVAGTNGKGSVVAMLEAIAIAAGLNVCCYTSPHLFAYNERIKINGRAVADRALCEAFERIDQARGDTQLTYFEFGTLAAIDLFFRHRPDLVILETGLGGRLDAVNLMDADISIITSVAIDHTDWLGDDRQSIGYEKAGIFRSGKPVICGDAEPPESVINRARELQCKFILAGRDYRVAHAESSSVDANSSWTLRSCYGDIHDLPAPSLAGEFQKSNAATAILALQVLQAQQPGYKAASDLDSRRFKQAISSGLTAIDLPGRFQLIHNRPPVYVDVAHNPQAAQALASQLKSNRTPRQKNTWAIVAMLADKDIAGVIESMAGSIDLWCFAGLENVTRGLTADELIARLPVSILPQPETVKELVREADTNRCTILTNTVMLSRSVANACESVLSKAEYNDRIVIFGSFFTVTHAMLYFSGLNNDKY